MPASRTRVAWKVHLTSDPASSGLGVHRLNHLSRNEPATIKSSSNTIRASSNHSSHYPNRKNQPRWYKVQNTSHHNTVQPSRLFSKAQNIQRKQNPAVVAGISARLSKCTAHLEGVEEASQPLVITWNYSLCMSAPYRSATSMFSGFRGK